MAYIVRCARTASGSTAVACAADARVLSTVPVDVARLLIGREKRRQLWDFPAHDDFVSPEEAWPLTGSPDPGGNPADLNAGSARGIRPLPSGPGRDGSKRCSGTNLACVPVAFTARAGVCAVKRRWSIVHANDNRSKPRLREIRAARSGFRTHQRMLDTDLLWHRATDSLPPLSSTVELHSGWTMLAYDAAVIRRATR